jgi:serine/threonine protein kinase
MSEPSPEKPQLPPPAPTRHIIYPKEGEVVSFQNRLYRLGAPMGQGGFGIVYACTDDWGNSLAAKVLLPQGRPYEIVQQDWQRELRNLVLLRHPNITHVYDAFEWRDTFYIITERGNQTLNELITWPEIKGELWLLPMARCVLQAIHFIHQSGYVHKDIHPGNVFLRYIPDEMNPAQNQALVFKVGDLGISRLASEIDVFNTILAQWMIPPEFLNPKDFGTVGPQTDIYHTGLLCLSLLAGKIIEFTQEEILDGKPRQLAESLQSPYAPAIAHALRRHVADRTQTPLDFWRELAALAAAATQPQIVQPNFPEIPDLAKWLSPPDSPKKT